MQGCSETSDLCPNLGAHAGPPPYKKSHTRSRRGAACCALAVGQGKPCPYNRNPPAHHLK